MQVGFAVTWLNVHDKAPNKDGVKMASTDPTGAKTKSTKTNALGVEHLGLGLLRLAHTARVFDISDLQGLKVGDSFRIGDGALEMNEAGCDYHFGVPDAGNMCVSVVMHVICDADDEVHDPYVHCIFVHELYSGAS